MGDSGIPGAGPSRVPQDPGDDSSLLWALISVLAVAVVLVAVFFLL